ncbi:hypothetical protein [Oleidesulfovibrio sp.]|uniref:hypothetical protein n=1 Tax=Oleidesulfovibrio sp. TaxID=2909707 RepID=UPI003A83E345
MPYNSETGQYERRVTTILDETPDGDTVNSAVAVKIDAAVDDGPTDLNHHKAQGGHYPATSTATGSRYLHQSPAGVVSWRDGVPADQAAQADASNVADGAAWRAAIGAEAAGAAAAAVATHNADASAHGLDTTVWPVAQGGTGASTAEDARAALDVYSKGDVDAALGGIKTGTAHAPQSIIKAPLGARPTGWTAEDCDAPVMSILAPQVPLFSAHWCCGMTVRESSRFSADTPAWKLLNGTAVNSADCWASVSGSFVGGVGDEYVEIDFGVERSVSAINILPRLSTDWLLKFPRDFQLIADGVVVENITGLVPAAQQTEKAVPLSASFRCKVLRMRVTNIQDTSSSYVVFGRLNITFDDVPAGHVAIPSGLQVAYADEGRVAASEVSNAMQSIDLSAAADGTYHIAVNMNADGSFAAPSHSNNTPQISTRKLLSYPVPVAASSENTGREIGFSVDGDLATYWGANSGSGAGVIGQWAEYTLPDSKGGFKSIVAKASQSYVGSAPAAADIEQLVSGIWVKVGEAKYLNNVLCGSFQATAGNTTLRIKATAGTVSYSYGWTITDIQVTDLTAGDLYNPSDVTHYGSTDTPIRRVYLGWVEKYGGVITDVHCYALSKRCVVPLNAGGTLATGTNYSINTPFLMPVNAAQIRELDVTGMTDFNVFYSYDSAQFRGWIRKANTEQTVTVGSLSGKSANNYSYSTIRAALIIERGY